MEAISIGLLWLWLYGRRPICLYHPCNEPYHVHDMR